MPSRNLSRMSLVFAGALLLAIGFNGLAQDASLTKNNSAVDFVTRGKVALNLAGAELIGTAARAKAANMQVNVNIAIVDDGGHLISFARMDKARPASISTAMTKAVAAATTRVATGPVRRGDAEPDLLLNLSLQSAAANSGGKMTALLGGIPIIVEGQVIGAVGVGGGTGEQDAEVAKAGIDALLQNLKP